MNRFAAFALPALAAALAAGALAQQAGHLTRVQPPQQGAPSEADAWRERLTQEDLDLREQAFDRVVEQALRDPQLRHHLEAWAREGSGELAWTSRLALRALEGGMPGHPFSRRFGMGGADLLDPDALLERFGLPRGFDRRGWDRMEELFQAPPAGPGGPGQRSAESFQLEMGPGGVKARITRDVDGETATEEYEAASLEELLEAHPELRERVGTPGGTMLRFGFPGMGGGLLGAAPRTDVLGVVVRPLSADEARGRGLAGVEGLFVERVSPGTIAASLGVQHGHVLLELNGRALRGAEDISAVLSGRAEDEGIELRLLDRWGQERTRVWSPERTLQRTPRPLNPRRL